MNQKEKEIISFKTFFSLISRNRFIDDLINVNCPEPADIIYNEQGYQITTGDGQHFGKILATTKRFNINDIENRTVNSVSNINEIINIVLLPILKHKKLSADKAIILLIFVYNSIPFTDDQLKKRLKDFSKLNQNLLDIWKEVWCIFPNKALIIFP
ncbi:MAG: hypothetical protein PHH83_02895 [Patescibacteria group bacterium]|nr:hypothetical protein [Patescibacteria group bacterium]